MAGLPRGLDHTRRLHRERLEPYEPDIDADPRLAAAWHQLQLHWLATVPGYREQIRERVREALNESDAERGSGRNGRRCSGCNGELESYTDGCRTCINRQQRKRYRRQRREGGCD